MKYHLLAAVAPLFVLAACAESDAPDAAADTADPMAELAAGTGPYLVTYPDGTQGLFYSAADGTEWGGPMEGTEPATWEVVDGQVCVDPPGEAEDGSSNLICLSMGEVGEDGSWSVVPANEPGETPATMRRLDAAAATAADQVAAGSYLVDLPEQGTALIVWTDDGRSYLAMNAQQVTWRAEGSQRCSTPADGTETCGTPTSEMDENGSFTADDGANGTITVTML